MSEFSETLETFRKKKGYSKKELAYYAELAESYVSHLTLGTRKNPSLEVVTKLADALQLNDEEKKALFEAAELPYPPPSLPAVPVTPVLPVLSKTKEDDWGDVPRLQAFFGREKQLEELDYWILKENCQLLVVSGSGGIGKTMLTVRLARDIDEQFEHVFWRSLKDAPGFEHILNDCLSLLSRHKPIEPGWSVEDRIRKLLDCMKEKRCLLILDNMESILQEKGHAGEYREGYEEYGRLLDAIGSVSHKSCLIVTTREVPKEVARLQGKTGPVRIYPLSGLELEDGLKILADKGLDWETQREDAEKLFELYSGNPLALQVAAVFIDEALAGNISTFLTSSVPIFEDIHDVLKQQFERLTELEQHVMYWLAIEREAVTLPTLQQDFPTPYTVMELATALQSLRRRSLIEIREQVKGYSLQEVIQTFITQRLIDQVVKELQESSFCLLESHALLKAQAKDYLRDAQRLYVLDPIARALLERYGREECETHLRKLLLKLHDEPASQGYGGANLLHLFLHLKFDLSDCDFSGLYIRQAYLQGVALHDVNFAYAHFEDCSFTDTFRSILSLAYSPDPDNRWLAAGTENGDIRLWEAASGSPVRTYKGHTARVRAIAFDPSGNWMVSGSEDTTVRLWSVDTDQCVHVMQGHEDRVRTVAMSPDGGVAASGGDDGSIRLWDLNTGACLRELEGHSPVRTVVFNRQGDLLASGDEDGYIRLWNAQAGDCLKTLPRQSGEVHSVNFNHVGDLLVSGGQDAIIRLWDVSSGMLLKSLSKEHENQIRSVVFNADGTLLVSSSDDQTIRLWDVSSGQYLRIFQGHKHRVYTAVFNQSGQTIVSGSEDQTVRFWEVASGRCFKILQGYVNQVRAVAFSPRGDLLVSGGDDDLLRLWEMPSGRYLRELRGHDNGVRAVAFHPDGDYIASASDDRTVRLWHVKSGRCIRELREHNDRVRTVAFNRDGKWLASAGEDGLVRVWITLTGQRLWVFEGHRDWVRTVAFHPLQPLLASGSEDGEIRFWHLETGACLQVLQSHTNGVRSVVFHPSGSLFASSSDDKTIRLWQRQSETDSWEPLTVLERSNRWILSLAFSPDGKLLARGGEDHLVRIWKLETRQCLQELTGHTHRIYGVAFHPDGRMFASASLDGTVRVWNVETGNCLHILQVRKPYEGMNIAGARGLREEQRTVLRALGAIENE
jgi:WD40 repeat protein/transcriptional regulator with XRE-family HTH domain